MDSIDGLLEKPDENSNSDHEVPEEEEKVENIFSD